MPALVSLAWKGNLMTAWRRTRDATVLWSRRQPRVAALAAPVVFACYLACPLAAVRALSDARRRPG